MGHVYFGFFLGLSLYILASLGLLSLSDGEEFILIKLINSNVEFLFA
mgnify:CR=1 FL=1|jgi:hypothetical protein